MRLTTRIEENYPIASLAPHPRNANQGDEKHIAESIEHNGFWGTVVANERNGRILAGNFRVKALKAAGETVVDVAWVDVDEEEELRILLADNRTARLGHDDPQALANLLQELVESDDELAGTGYDEKFLHDLLKSLGEEDAPDPGAGGDDFDPELQGGQTRTQSGDLWLIDGGKHRLAVGDSTDPDLVRTLFGVLPPEIAELVDAAGGDVPMSAVRLEGPQAAACIWTDPPYGVDYVGKTKSAKTIQNDGAEGLADLLTLAFAVASEMLSPGGAIYIAHPAGPNALTFAQKALEVGWTIKQQLVWVKNTMVLGRSDYHYAHEPILYCCKPLPSGEGRTGRGGKLWWGDNAQTTVFNVDKPARSEDHPTMKPVSLIEPMLKNSTGPGGIVYEPFGGSGSTLIAARRANRRCFAVELDLQYADVILKRCEAEGMSVELAWRPGESVSSVLDRLEGEE
jgi:DNA modification methylase